MSFIAKNPMTIPEIETAPPTPLTGTRGLFAKSDGWYDIDNEGNMNGLQHKTDDALKTTDKTVVGAINEIDTNKELEIERIKYYGDPNVVPSDESWFTVNSTGETITGLTDTGKTQTELVIPYRINGVKITDLDNSGTSILVGNDVITKVILPNSIVTIGNHAFLDCTSLTSINIPNSVTSIESSAFAECTSLTNIEIPDSVTSIGINAFAECTSLTSINIPDSVTSIKGGAFWACISLTSINIPNSVTSIGNVAFAGYTNLTIYCEQGSYAETYAKDNSIPIMYTDVKTSAIDNKVDKVEGKGLSTEDYTTEEKTKLYYLPTNEALGQNMQAISTEAKSYALIVANEAEQNAKNYVDGRLDKEFELLAEVEITETGISSVMVNKDANNNGFRLKKIFVDCVLAPIDDNAGGNTTYQSGQLAVTLYFDNPSSYFAIVNRAWIVNATNFIPTYFWIENKKPMGVLCSPTTAAYATATMGFPVFASQHNATVEVITGIKLHVGSSSLPDMPVGTKFKVWGVKE